MEWYNAKVHENKILTDVNKREISKFFSSGKSAHQTDISQVNRDESAKTELKLKKIMSSKKSSSGKSTSKSGSASSSATDKGTFASVARSIQKRLGLTVFFSEMLGSFLVEFFASIAKDGTSAYISVALAIGLLNFIFQDTSGAHFHPLLTVSRWFVSKDVRWLKMIKENKVHERAVVSSAFSCAFLIFAQFLGVFLGATLAFLMRGLFPTQEPPDFVSWVAFLMELFGFLTIVLTFISTNKAMYLFRPFFLSAVWLLAGLVSNPYSGAILNPFRWIALVIFSQNHAWQVSWVYIVAPCAATILGVSICKQMEL